MPLTALLVLLVAAPQPDAGAPERTASAAEPAAAAAAPEAVVRALSLSAGPSRGSLYGLRLAGAGIHLAYGPTFAWTDAWTWGLQIGGAVARTWTPAGLAVTDVAYELAVHVGTRRARAGVGAEFRVIDVERVTETYGALRDYRIDPVAFLSVDALRLGRTAVFVEARGHGLASTAWMAQLTAGMRL